MFARLFRFAIIAGAIASAPLHAEDIELYIGSNVEAGLLPNVVFIVDTSGSMKGEVPNTAVVPDTSDCDKNKVYWKRTGGDLPVCKDNDQWFWAAKNKCKHAVDALAGGNYSTDNFAMWNDTDKRWYKLDTSGQEFMLECKADYPAWYWGWWYGGHGKDEGDGKPYPTRDTGWQSTESSSKTIRWNSYDTYNLYSGKYLIDHAEAKNMTRIEVAKAALIGLLESTSGINAAVMRFNGGSGGYFVTPMLALAGDETTVAANRKTLIDAIEALGPDDYTPLSETLYEAGLYYRGETPKYGKDITPAALLKDGKYISPIQNQCQKNYIVLFTDGDPYSDGDADSLIKSQPDWNTYGQSCGWSTNCLAAEAKYLHTADLLTLQGPQHVETYTVAFEGVGSSGKDLLTYTATLGGGAYYYANNLASLRGAFDDILGSILEKNDTFSAPAVTVNAFNRLTHLDELYFALFRSTDDPKWDGNIKRYRLAKPDGKDYLAILDRDGAEAIDPGTGFFTATARSFWSAAADGEQVSSGGAAAMMPDPASRKVYTCCFDTAGELTDAKNRVTEDTGVNPNLTSAELGCSEENRVEIIKWARGVDTRDSDGDGSKTDARTQLGDPLHPEPQLITYGKHTDDTVDLTLFTTTNEGFLHAIDTRTGKELFSYIPRELLKNLRTLALNDASYEGHPYGLDGPMTVWVYDKDSDGTIEPADGDHVYLYLTMRRGGNGIYALDVTDRSKPKQMWKIEGGITAGFAELGLTFSKPVLSKVKMAGTVRNVLFFGGGYDTNQDAENVSPYNQVAEDDSRGRAVFMVGADYPANDGGKLLWSAGPDSSHDLVLSEMTNSIPAEVRVIQIDADSLADRLYFGDTRGRIWRIDINNANETEAEFATGGIIAKLGTEASEAGNRRFFYAPSVSLSTTGQYLNIAIGSGYREHPTNKTIQDRFYVIRDRNVEKLPTLVSGKYPVMTNFMDATTWVTAADISATDLALLPTSDGFYIDLKEGSTWQGEKVLAPALTISGTVIFTTFTPVTTAACAGSEGTARVYYVNVEDSTAVGSTQRYEDLKHGGIPPRPVALTVEDGSIILVGTEAQDNDRCKDGKGLCLGEKQLVRKLDWRRK